MPLSDYIRRLLRVAETMHCWCGALAEMDRARRIRLARYADRVAATLGRAGAALAKLESGSNNPAAVRTALRELGRIEGHVETMVRALRHHLDGRKLAGVKRRLEGLGGSDALATPAGPAISRHIDRLAAAEGYFRALADWLRA